MAFTLGSFVADSTLSFSTGKLPAYLVDSTLAAGAGKLPAYVTNSLQQRLVGALPRFIALNDGPTQLTFVSSGGSVAYGSAPRSFTLNGVAVNDPSVYTITSSGGAISGGVANFQYLPTLQFNYIGRGTAAVGGEAPVVYNWTARSMVGGSVASGSATVNYSSPVILGSLSVIGQPSAFSASGYPFGSVICVAPAAQVAASGTVGVAGAMSATAPSAFVSAVGGQASLSAYAPASVVQATGTVGVSYELSASATAARVSASGTVGIVGNIAATSALASISLTSTVGVVGAMDVAAIPARSKLEAVRGVSGSISVTLPVAAAELSAVALITGTMKVTLPKASAQIRADYLEQQILTMVANTVTGAASFYVNYPLNSFCQFNNKYFGAGPDGLFQIETNSDDNGTEIEAVVSTGDLSFNDEHMKRLTDFYVGMRAAGNMTVLISTDEGDSLEYTVETYDVSTLRQRRVKTAKGARGKYWRFGLKNTNGCDFEIDNMTASAVPTARRI